MLIEIIKFRLFTYYLAIIVMFPIPKPAYGAFMRFLSTPLEHTKSAISLWIKRNECFQNVFKYCMGCEALFADDMNII